MSMGRNSFLSLGSTRIRAKSYDMSSNGLLGRWSQEARREWWSDTEWGRQTITGELSSQLPQRTTGAYRREPEKWYRIDVSNLWQPRGEGLGYLYTAKSLDESKFPKGLSTGREDFHCYVHQLSGTELQTVAAGNWLEHSEMLGSKECLQGTGSLLQWCVYHLLFFFSISVLI